MSDQASERSDEREYIDSPGLFSTDPALRRMQLQIDQWDADGDRRVVFLRCYQMMTGNMLAAIDRQEFHDSAWVGKLLHRFADYYFIALEAYEAGTDGQRPPDHLADTGSQKPTDHSAGNARTVSDTYPGKFTPTPPVWQLAFNAASQPSTLALQNLLLGVNAHINYDLILALVDILEAEWDSLAESQRNLRYEDHCHVNRVIGSTIDAVQDQVLEPAMPVMELIDKIMGPVDEILVSRLLSHWRDSVWRNAIRLLEAHQPDERASLVKKYEENVLQLGEVIQLKSFHPNADVQAE